MAKIFAHCSGTVKWVDPTLYHKFRLPHMDVIEVLEDLYGCPIWQSQDTNLGENVLVPLATMEPNHMVNAYKMLVRIRNREDLAYKEAREQNKERFLVVPVYNGPDWNVGTEADYICEVRPMLTKWISSFAIWMERRGIEVPEMEEVPVFDRDELLEEAIDILRYIMKGDTDANWEETWNHGLSEKGATA